MTVDDTRPIWVQLVEEFRRCIVTGRWPSGSRVPSVRELAQRAGVNPNTVQRTLAELERDGLCRSERAVGRFVTDDAERVSRLRCDLAAGAADEFTTRVKGFGLTEAEAVALIAERWNQQ